ncbi:hypothetical protein [Bacillus cereus]|uniref:hypothetical protein n=1 Tax=Bacillus cereus TaxID=1396 RepID=UPI000C28638A|nr:hypothetical protein [Bacillus cereus]
MSNKKRESFYWNLKKIENEEFFNWFESQSNIADSLYKLVCYFIDKHGLQDVADYKIQQQMQREILLQDEDFLNDMKRILLNNSNFIIKNTDVNTQHQIDDQKEIVKNFEEPSYNEDICVKEDSKSETSVLKEEYDDLDTTILFGN